MRLARFGGNGSGLTIVTLVLFAAVVSTASVASDDVAGGGDTQSHNQDFLRGLQSLSGDQSSAARQDINPALFRDFWLKWELVTTRYKMDGNELRFIYANKTGSEALAKGTYPFPEGTVFAKIGTTGVHDPIFDNSLVPGRIARVQIMLREPSNPKARNGWVYALYMNPPHDRPLKQDEIGACAACHAVAKSRDMIFAQPFPTPFGAAPAPSLEASPFRDRFHDTPMADLPEVVRNMIQTVSPPSTKSAMRLTMPAFSGTLFEARELLARFARTSHLPYVLNSPDGKEILIAVPKDKCVTMGSVDRAGPMERWNMCDDTTQIGK